MPALPSKADGKLLLEQIRKLNCEGCLLKTEHYVQKSDSEVLFSRCLKCGRVTSGTIERQKIGQDFPTDDQRPVYVF